MKKLVLGLIVAALVTLGLVGAPSAQADPYPGTVAVAAPAVVKAKPGKKAKIVLTPASGNLTPTGQATVVCKASGKAKVKSKGTLDASGAVKTGKLAKGKWTCKVTFAGSGIYKSSTATVKVKVK
ncbi:hypothetical protein [Nocardioides daeguensis]|uniref:Ig-like domain repeat protein n=1 Tax=Nocardioides daeguensis TaxID=908359 RepID=A0ABP6V909_9ACTN|nr:hypothetical protein [Nocardioides daeguensis]MBV6726182.1 hypothetical protein [Nocardioides daeguensis]MCR1772025.1 hypothetical protein [Nocardioides daeguensis]